ncbi:glutaredoxin [Brucella intermedia]|uniref:Glutaredoxin n=1 Tax=Brucella intermedia M86 TaxID=1234597 RepID=M5K5N8_9HYPH|nr:glutaredoxin [Brucella intermedia]ELT51226.1 glutaredoxin [Brucella intermedia M86]
MAKKKVAEIYRMVTPDFTCSFGVKALKLLEQSDFLVNEHVLASREEVDAFKAEHGVETTPQTFIDGVRIGGYDELKAYFEAANSAK